MQLEPLRLDVSPQCLHVPVFTLKQPLVFHELRNLAGVNFSPFMQLIFPAYKALIHAGHLSQPQLREAMHVLTVLTLFTGLCAISLGGS
jgi:hypothetical protein